MIVTPCLMDAMSTETTSLGIFPKTIGGLLKEKNLKVPPSQRSYRWDAENVNQLFTDIQTAIDEPDDEYFLGSIISIDSKKKIAIYDGQQRLATTMILIAAIRDYCFLAGEADLAADTERDFLVSKKERGSTELTSHLTLNTKDHEYFAARVLAREDAPNRKALPKPSKLTRDSHKRIDGAATAAKAFVATIIGTRTGAAAISQLNKWLKFIEDSLTIIGVQVASEKMAFVIFETMNDRGLGLSASDLLKNLLHSKTEDDRRDTIIQKWDSMCGVLETITGEEENIVEYVRCFWVMKNGQTRTRVLYDRIKDRITNDSKAIEFATQLESAVQSYAAIVLSSHDLLSDRGGTVKSNIETLRILGVSQLRPLLLAAFEKFSAGEFAKILERCVAWSIRFLITGEPSGNVEGYYARAATEVWNGQHTSAKQVIAVVKVNIPDDALFKAAFSVTTVKNTNIARLYLRALQVTADGKTDPDYSPSQLSHITLEHILPVKPDPGWEHFSDEERKAYVYRLGNLALIGSDANGKLGSKSFSQKKETLENDTTYSLTKEAGKETQWRAEEINKRQLRLADLAVSTWPIL